MMTGWRARCGVVRVAEARAVIKRSRQRSQRAGEQRSRCGSYRRAHIELIVAYRVGSQYLGLN